MYATICFFHSWHLENWRISKLIEPITSAHRNSSYRPQRRPTCSMSPMEHSRCTAASNGLMRPQTVATRKGRRDSTTLLRRVTKTCCPCLNRKISYGFFQHPSVSLAIARFHSGHGAGFPRQAWEHVEFQVHLVDLPLLSPACFSRASYQCFAWSERKTRTSKETHFLKTSSPRYYRRRPIRRSCRLS